MLKPNTMPKSEGFYPLERNYSWVYINRRIQNLADLSSNPKRHGCLCSQRECDDSGTQAQSVYADALYVAKERTTNNLLEMGGMRVAILCLCLRFQIFSKGLVMSTNNARQYLLRSIIDLTLFILCVCSIALGLVLNLNWWFRITLFFSALVRVYQGAYVQPMPWSFVSMEILDLGVQIHESELEFSWFFSLGCWSLWVCVRWGACIRFNCFLKGFGKGLSFISGVSNPIALVITEWYPQWSGILNSFSNFPDWVDGSSSLC